MAVKATIEKLEDVPEILREHYREVTYTGGDNKPVKVFALDFDGAPDSHPVVHKLKNEAGQRRIELKAANDKLTAFAALGDRKIEDIVTMLEKYPELEQAAKGKLDDKQLEALAEQRAALKVGPVARERDTFKKRAEDLEKENGELKGEKRTRLLQDAIRAAIKDSKGFQDTAVEDAFMLGERQLEINDEGQAVVKDSGLSVKDWLIDQQSRRPHWWGPTGGGGARGGLGGGGGTGGDNPWTFEGWNMTKQGAIVKENRARADQLAAAAGTTVGGKKPNPRK